MKVGLISRVDSISFGDVVTSAVCNASADPRKLTVWRLIEIDRNGEILKRANIQSPKHNDTTFRGHCLTPRVFGDPEIAASKIGRLRELAINI